MLERLVFGLGDKLPIYYGVAIAIFQVASKPKSKKMGATINFYAQSLIDI